MQIMLSAMLVSGFAFGAQAAPVLAGATPAIAQSGDVPAPTPAASGADSNADSDADSSAGAEPVPAVATAPIDQGLLVDAGRRIPAGLTAARLAERGRARDEALARLAGELDTDGARYDQWTAHLAAVLESPDEHAEVWEAAALVAGQLGLYDLAPVLANALSSARPRRALAAREALHELYGQWFESLEDFAAFPVDAPDGPALRALLRRYRERGDAWLTQLGRNFKLDPAYALEFLAHPDPRVRQRAAAAIPAAVSVGQEPKPGTIGLPAATDALLARLSVEEHPAAWHAVADALLAVFAAAPVGPEVRARFVQALEGVVQRRQAGLELPVARALSRTPWPDAGTTPPGLPAAPGAAHGVDLVAALLDALAERRTRADPDVLVGVLESLQTLATRAERDAIAAAQAAGEPAPLVVHECARDAVTKLLADPSLYVGVRAAAASSIPLVARPADIEQMVAVLGAPESPSELRFALLGALGRMARVLDPTSDEAAKLHGAVVARIDEPQADLRRRALSMLAEPALADHVRGEDLSKLVERLDVEPVAELRAKILGILRTSGSRDLLDGVLELESFDELAVQHGAELAQLLGKLAADDPAKLVEGAQRLASVQDAPSSLDRLLRAMTLLAGLGEQAARGLDVAAHLAVVEWTTQVRDAGVVVADAVPNGRVFLRRVVDVHVPGAARSERFGEGRRLHTSSLLLGDLLGGADDPALEQQVLDTFAQALERAKTVPGEPPFEEVLRDRARFYESRGRLREALDDYRPLLKPNGGALAPARVLEPSDLREAATLLVTARRGAAADGAAGEACDVLLGLVDDAQWTQEPAAVRVQDLTDVVDRALASKDSARIERVRALLADLPPLPADGAGPLALVEGRTWSGLTADRGSHEALLAARSKLDPRSPPPSAPEPVPPAEGGESGGAAGRPLGG